ncbi:MAG: hypothetical protein JXB25_04855 [Deltaproteobacteria bacterium]|nr:hypothetical protein [Deltaproteobacteria bacterium]
MSSESEYSINPEVPHPNPFTLAQIRSFFRRKGGEPGSRVTLFTGPNWYAIHWQGKPLARIRYYPARNEWTVESFQEKSMMVPYTERGNFRYKLVSCWCQEGGELKCLDEALKRSLTFRQ